MWNILAVRAKRNDCAVHQSMDHPLRFKFSALKSAQAACMLLQMSGGRRNYMELVKLLYLADRKALVELECPITGDRFCSLPNGPVLSRILNLIRWGPISEEDEPWFQVVSAPEGYTVKLVKECEDGELSGAEIQILKQVFEEYGRRDWKELSRITHQLPEWNDPDGGSIPIPAEQILRLEGRTQEQINRIKDDVSLFQKIDSELEQFTS
jgi:uncharacterized phage-associated protein